MITDPKSLEDPTRKQAKWRKENAEYQKEIEELSAEAGRILKDKEKRKKEKERKTNSLFKYQKRKD